MSVRSRYRYNGSITDERMDVFLEMLYGDIPDYLCEIEKYADNIHAPVMRRQAARCLQYNIISKCAASESEATSDVKILEIGTAIGYSALFMAHIDHSVKIDTIEKVPDRINIAKDFFKKYDKHSQITLIEGDAADILPMLVKQKNNYDIIFLDAAKAQYLHYLTDVERLLSKKGILITDNVLQEGELLESRYAVTRRDRTIHKRMREYLHVLTHSPDIWNTMIIPVADGIAVSTKICD